MSCTGRVDGICADTVVAANKKAAEAAMDRRIVGYSSKGEAAEQPEDRSVMTINVRRPFPFSRLHFELPDFLPCDPF